MLRVAMAQELLQGTSADVGISKRATYLPKMVMSTLELGRDLRVMHQQGRKLRRPKIARLKTNAMIFMVLLVQKSGVLLH